jgi:hypothetical protein
MKSEISGKLGKTHEYNCLVGRFYDEEKEKQFQEYTNN